MTLCFLGWCNHWRFDPFYTLNVHPAIHIYISNTGIDHHGIQTHRVSSSNSVVSLTRRYTIGAAKIMPATVKPHVDKKMFMYL